MPTYYIVNILMYAGAVGFGQGPSPGLQAPTGKVGGAITWSLNSLFISVGGFMSSNQMILLLNPKKSGNRMPNNQMPVTLPAW